MDQLMLPEVNASDFPELFIDDQPSDEFRDPAHEDEEGVPMDEDDDHDPFPQNNEDALVYEAVYDDEEGATFYLDGEDAPMYNESPFPEDDEDTSMYDDEEGDPFSGDEEDASIYDDDDNDDDNNNDDDDDDEEVGPWNFPGHCAPLSPKQVKTLRGMLPMDALKLEAIKARLDNINEFVDKYLWKLRGDKFWTRCHEFCGPGVYDGICNFAARYIRRLLATTAGKASSAEGSFSSLERGFFQTDIYRFLICKSSRLGHVMLKRNEKNCNGPAVLCRLDRREPTPGLVLRRRDDLSGALEFDHVLEESKVMRYFELLYAPSQLDFLVRGMLSECGTIPPDVLPHLKSWTSCS